MADTRPSDRSEKTGPSSAPRILLVDDDPAVASALETYFDLYGWKVYAEATGEAGLEHLQEDRDLDLVLLDINLPGMSGFEVLERSQEMGVVAPVIMISTSVDDENRLRAFGLGAEDYFSKPFDPERLKERIEQIVGLDEDTASPQTAHLQIGDATIDLEEGLLQRDEEQRRLSETDRKLLLILWQNREQVVSRKRLLKEGLGVDQDEVWFSFTRRALYDMLDKHIDQVLHLIEPNPRRPVHLETVYGQGYRLHA